MKKQKVFTVVKCEDELPDEPFSGIGIMSDKYALKELSKTNLCLLGNYFLSTKPKDQYSHWLKEGEKYVFGEDELIELLKGVLLDYNVNDKRWEESLKAFLESRGVSVKIEQINS